MPLCRTKRGCRCIPLFVSRHATFGAMGACDLRHRLSPSTSRMVPAKKAFPVPRPARHRSAHDALLTRGSHLGSEARSRIPTLTGKVVLTAEPRASNATPRLGFWWRCDSGRGLLSSPPQDVKQDSTAPLNSRRAWAIARHQAGGGPALPALSAPTAMRALAARTS